MLTRFNLISRLKVSSPIQRFRLLPQKQTPIQSKKTCFRFFQPAGRSLFKHYQQRLVQSSTLLVLLAAAALLLPLLQLQPPLLAQSLLRPGVRPPIRKLSQNAVGAAVVQSGAVYRLRNQCSQKVLDVSGAGMVDGTQIIQWTEHSGGNQQWRIEATDSGYYRLVAQHSQKVLDVSASNTADGTRVQQWTHNATNAQQWRIVDVGDGYSRLESRLAANKVLDVSNASTNDGARVQLWTHNNTCAQKWKLEQIGATTPPSDRIRLPVEVIGADGYTTSVSFDLADSNGVDRLWLQCHRCGYRDQSTNQTRGAKGSVRINGGNWIDLSNQTAELAEPEKAYDGIGGGFYTTRFSVPVNNFVQGRNTLEFRFNGTDGFTSGYRIVDLNLLRGNQKVLPSNAFVQDNPHAWQPPLSNPADISEGDRLWHEASLLERPGGAPISVSCVGCHASGEHINDLKYYNFSNHSIVERSKFHGLSEQQSKQIASYIRSIALKREDGSVYSAPGRPWNPPFQPGPGDKPVEEWAAGAGVNAVLERDSDILPYLFPNGMSQAAMNAVASTKSTLDMRKLPVAIQMPDILAWWAEIHPQDIWGDYFNTGIKSPAKAYQNALNRLDSRGGPGNVPADQFILDGVEWFAGDGIDGFLWAGGDALNRVPAHINKEDAQQAMRQWTITKLFELHHEYGLHNEAPRLYPAGERGWIGRARTVFEIAPHRSANNGENFRYQSHKVGKYFSTAWYHLQVILNPGYRDNLVHIPVDWKYHLDHIGNLSQWWQETPGEGVRHVASLIKDMQMWDNQNGVRDAARGWNLREVKIEYISAPYYAKMNGSMSPDVHRKVVEAVLRAWLEKSVSHPISEYQRWGWKPDGTPDAVGGDYRWAPADLPYPAPQSVRDKGLDEYPKRLMEAISYARSLGVDGNLLNQMADFGEAMWHQYPFESLKSPVGAGSGTGLRGEYFDNQDLSNLKLTRTDARINFAWGDGSPDPLIGNDTYSARWTGWLEPVYGQAYTFHLNSDDGVRLWVNNQLVINAWQNGEQNKSGTINLTAGEKVPVKLEYFENGGAARARLEWESLGQLREVVPQSRLYLP